MKLTPICILTAAMLMSACSTLPNMKGYNGAGTIVGAATGGYIGTKFGNTSGGIAGGLLGAYAGYNILRMFGEKRDYAMEAFQRSEEHTSKGVTTNWHDPHKWEYGSYTPTGTIQTSSGVYCRRMLETVKINQRLYQNTVQACRNKDGRWVVEK